MNHSLPVFAARAICALVACLFLCFPAGAAGEQPEKKSRKILYNPEARDMYSARQSGDWNSDIWCVRRANQDDLDLKPAERGLRPAKEGNAEINGPNVTVTLAEPMTIANFRVMRDGGKLAIEPGGVLNLEKGYDGQGGFEYEGEVEVQKGGVMNVMGNFCVAGANLTDTGKGVFNQNGGDVSISGTLFLTGPRPTSSSAQATGVYNLNGGTLAIGGNPGLRNGVGHGSFQFGAGTLDTAFCDLDLTNAKGGNLSPAGDAAVGTTALTSVDGRTYTQGSDGRFTVNIAALRKFDALVWKSKRKDSKVIFEDGAVLWISFLGDYKPVTGVVFDVIECDAIELRGKLRMEGPEGKNFVYEVKPGPKAGLRLKYSPGGAL